MKISKPCFEELVMCTDWSESLFPPLKPFSISTRDAATGKTANKLITSLEMKYAKKKG
jgi:hypothetical protein